MKTLIVYESMFGNTRQLAEAMARGFESGGAEATVAPAAIVPDDVDAYDLVVVGAPTHAHSLPRPSSREQAVTWAADSSKNLVLEEYAERDGVREWLVTRDFSDARTRFAAFCTRADIPRVFAGDADLAIAKRLIRHGAVVESRADFLVDLDNRLVEGEEDRAQKWAVDLVTGS